MSAQHRPLSLSGTPLSGDRLVRMCYLDESGVSDDEPHLVVAGAIIHADRQRKAIEQHLRDLRDKYIPSGLPKNRIFHATDLFHGAKNFPRENWPQELRWRILDELVSIPEKFSLPIVCGVVRKSDLPEAYRKRKTVQKIAISCQAIAFSHCAIAIDRWMKHSADADEVALIIAEDKEDVRAAMRGMLAFARRPPETLLPFLRSGDRSYRPLTRVVDTVYFAGKSDSSPLQIADACTFSIMRHLKDAKECERFYAPLQMSLAFAPRFAETQLTLSGT